jgi:nucleotide-binding universal stress UspA family protein
MSILAPWIVGIDLGPGGHGALAFATWLRRTSGVPVIGLRVLEVESRFATSVDAEAAVRAAIHERLTRLGLPLLDRIEVTAAGRVEDGLIAAGKDAEGLVLGRTAAGVDSRRVRLGQVARRVLRELPAPVVVVPPELTAVGEGPVLLATDLGPASAAAAAWAAAFAKEHERPLEVVHVAAPVDNAVTASAPRSPGGADPGATAMAEIGAWLAEHGLADTSWRLLLGEPVDQVAAAAAERSAAVVVVGSRRLAAAQQLFAASTSSALASCCACPVAVVPPG